MVVLAAVVVVVGRVVVLLLLLLLLLMLLLLLLLSPPFSVFFLLLVSVEMGDNWVVVAGLVVFSEESPLPPLPLPPPLLLFPLLLLEPMSLPPLAGAASVVAATWPTVRGKFSGRISLPQYDGSAAAMIERHTL